MIDSAILQILEVKVRLGSRLWVAYSGGLDSTVLLRCLANSCLYSALRAIHVNHDLSPLSDSWQSHCEWVCLDLSIPIVCKKVAVMGSGAGLEAAARNARHEVFAQQMSDGDILLTAHHRNDQVETLFLRLLRGAGLRGLCAMRTVQDYAGGTLMRPLLGRSREELLAFATDNSWHWVEDQSNGDERFDRNFLRHSILPLLAARWPGMDRPVADAAQHLQQVQEVLDEYLDKDIDACAPRVERVGHSLHFLPLLTWSASRRKAALRRWFQRLGVLMPSAAQLAMIESLMLAKQDAQACVSWGEHELRRYKDRIYLCATIKPLPRKPLAWHADQPLGLGNGFTLSAELSRPAVFTVSFRRAGLRCRPRGRQHSQSVKKLLQEYQLQPWLRDLVPFIYAGDTLVAVGDLWVCDCPEADALTSLSWTYSKGC